MRVPPPGEPVDFLGALGALAFASRLRRLQERLLKDVARVYRDLGADFEPRWFALFYALHAQGPAGVTELAQSLSVSHAGINLQAGQLLRAGLIREGRHPADERRRILRLSPRGRRLARQLTPVWNEIRTVTEEMFREADCDMLGALAALERVHRGRSVYERVQAARGEPPGPPVDIVDYRSAYKKHFRALNYAWLEEHFSVEPEDERLLSDPRRRIINRGGAVLFARARDEVVGTCALIRHDADLFELAKMAVAPAYRGRGIGRQIGLAAIGRARALGGRRLVLHTSPTLTAAVALYTRLGFRPCPCPGTSAAYARCTVAMDMDLGRPRGRKPRR